MLDYTITINGVDFTSAIERDSYTTNKTPVYSDSVVTMDGITHVTNLRNKSVVRFSLNPQNAADTRVLCTALLTMPCDVNYFSLQTQQYEHANMMLEEQSAQYLSRCLYRGQRWNQMEEIELTEL